VLEEVQDLHELMVCVAEGGVRKSSWGAHGCSCVMMPERAVKMEHVPVHDDVKGFEDQFCGGVSRLVLCCL
jgi:hypothetical protein